MNEKVEEEIINLADILYWEFIEKLSNGEKSQFVVNSFYDGGTVNTEEGSKLYYAIEDILRERINRLQKSLEIVSQE